MTTRSSLDIGRPERIVLAIALVALALLLVYTDWLWEVDQVVYDLHLRNWTRPPAEDVLIVAVDERSLSEMGRWPWSRRTHAELVDRLTAAGARAIGLDVVFAEPDPNDREADAALAKAIADSGRVVLPVLGEQVRLGGQLKETLPMPMLAAAARLGHVDVEIDADGVSRSVFLKAGLGEARWPHLGLALLESGGVGLEDPLPGQRNINPGPRSPHLWVRDHRILMPFAGPPGHFQRVSYVDVLRGAIPPQALRDKYVLVGATATGLGDALPTPVSGHATAMPGIEFNANVIDALLNGLALKPLATQWRMLLTAVLALVPLLLYPYLTPRQALLAALGSLAFVLLASLLLLRASHVWFPPAAALAVVALSFPLWSWRRLEGAVDALFEAKERAEVTLHSIGDAVITTDVAGKVEYLNPVAEALTGWAKDEARGRPVGEVLQVVDEHSREELVYPIARCLEDKSVIGYPEGSALASRSGHERAVQGSAAPIRNRKGESQGVVIAVSDMSGERAMAQRIEHQATHDALTGLPNRDLLLDRLKLAIARAQRAEQPVALMFVDLDRFKTVNDALGHSAGDALLTAVATRLKGCSREEDTVARLSSDEFAIVFEHLPHEEQVTAVAQKVRQALEAPHTVENHEFFVTGSIGICLFPKDGDNAETLLKNANIAMNRAKENGRNNVQYYSRDMNARALERLLLEQQLRYAIERDELELHYQPVVAAEGERVVGVEALLRWHHPEHGLLAPTKFIPLAEETGLIIPIGEWVLNRACEQAQAWQDEGLPALRVAVNLSPRQFMERGMTDMVAETLERTGFDAECLDFEITENVIMRDVDGAIAILTALKSMGVHLAIDDFGIGYSSLNYLKRFPIDRLKIDQSFVRDINTNADDAAIALAVIAMAHSMQLKVIAEGVETKAQLEYLRSRDCDEMQGFFFSRPVPADELTTMLRNAAELRSGVLH